MTRFESYPPLGECVDRHFNIRMGLSRVHLQDTLLYMTRSESCPLLGECVGKHFNIRLGRSPDQL